MLLLSCIETKASNFEYARTDGVKEKAATTNDSKKKEKSQQQQRAH
jgi:hypothetical protein